jgi:thiol-disulfide isomerase/thioredoxin
MKRLLLFVGTIILIMAFSITTEAKKRVLIECFTGTGCPYCGAAKPVAETIRNAYPGDVFVVDVHCGSGDPFNITEGLQLAGAFGIQGIPSSLIDRTVFIVNDDPMILFHPDFWEAVTPVALQQEEKLEVKMYYQINESTRELTATVEAEFLTSINSTAELCFNVYIVENNLVAYQAGQSSNYNHKQVLRKMLGGPFGTNGIIPSSVKAGDIYSHTYNFDLDASWKIEDLEFYGCVNELSEDVYNVKILNVIKGVESQPYSELTSTGAEISVQSTGETFSKIFTLKNITNEQVTFRINDEMSERTPSDWTSNIIVPESKIVSKSDKTQATELKLDPNETIDITLELIPGATIGIGDLNIEVLNRYDLGGQKSRAKITVVSKEVENLQVADYKDDSYSIKSQMTSSGLNNAVDITGEEFDEVGTMLTNLNTLVWNCGDAGEISPSEGSAISSAITDGASVMLMGGKMGTTIDDNASSLLNYIGIQYNGLCRQGISSQGNVTFVGYDDDPITDGMSLSGTIHYFTSAIEATGATTYPILKHRNTDTVLAARAVIGDARVVYLGTNPFYITNSYDRNNLIDKCLKWLVSTGPSISCADELEFDDTEAGMTSEQILTIENTGKSDLIVTDVEIEYDYQVNFSVVGDKNFTIPAEGSYDLTVKFKPSYAIDYNSWLKIYSNADNAAVRQVNLSGAGTEASAGPVVSLSVQELNFNDVDVESSMDLSFNIANTGNETLNVTNITVPAAYASIFIIEPTSFTVEPDEEQTVTVTFQPDRIGTFETNATIVSNNKNGAVQVALNANAIVGVDEFERKNSLMSINAGPNPFDANTNIHFTLNGDLAREVNIITIDATGRTIKEFANRSFNPGTYKFELNSTGLASGTYYIIAKTKNSSVRIPVVLTK